VRGRNEDRVHADAARGVYIVVDGMGGEAAGDQAAEAAIEIIRRRLERPAGSPEERIREAIAVANNEIVAWAGRDPALSGMGCVVTVAVIENGRASVGHVGDARAYLLRDGGIEKVTHDHSPVGEREERGELDERTAMRHPRRSEVFRSIGQQPRGPHDPDFVDVATFRVTAADALLLCSDGLTDLVASDEILAAARAHARDPEAVAERLVGTALERGGKDNVSVVFAVGPRFGSERAGGDSEEGPGAPTGAARAGVGEAIGALVRRHGVPFGLGILAGIGVAALPWPLEHASAPPVETPPPAAAARVLPVGPGQPFASIGDALGAARAGDTVLVRPGSYREQVRLPQGVTLASVVPHAAVLVPTGGATAVVAVVAERIGSGRITGFAIRSDRRVPLDVGIRLDDAAVTIEDVDVSGARLAAIAIEGPRPATIHASRIHDNPGAGIVVRSGASARIAHNRIEDNGRAAPASPGIELERGARAEIADNVIVGNGAAGVRGLAGAERAAALARNLFAAGGRSSRRSIAPAVKP
jgi:serine/threonine protein phosphatase PrpC